MYLIEWGFWSMSTETEAERKSTDAARTSAERKADQDLYREELESELHFNSASKTPKVHGPVFSFNENFMEMRCGGSEEKRGLITLATLGGLGPIIYFWASITLGSIYTNIKHPNQHLLISFVLDTYMLALGTAIIYFYYKYGLRFTRLEMLTSRHLLIRFNRKTQQVHLHRPSYCGGIVTFPWRSTGSTAIHPEDDALSLGMRLALVWHPIRTGLPHLEFAFLGKQGQGGSELRDEWEFIRRYMEEGPDAVPRPRLSTQLPSPIQAFSAQFEGLGRFFRHSGWPLKVALLLIWPAFVIIGTAHWVSLMLCWRPR
ncbi:hypothetical protein N5D48_25945, partial [Pseudomonas sp. GD03858]|uniref:DUF6708 domain-containing protein n=1 Tax=unclassified Pseudomonas TaxID=196821 RepID=UPI00244C67AE